jgi:hypothetical protein
MAAGRPLVGRAAEWPDGDRWPNTNRGRTAMAAEQQWRRADAWRQDTTVGPTTSGGRTAMVARAAAWRQGTTVGRTATGGRTAMAAGSCMAAGRACRSDSDWRPDGHGGRTAMAAEQQWRPDGGMAVGQRLALGRRMTASSDRGRTAEWGRTATCGRTRLARHDLRPDSDGGRTAGCSGQQLATGGDGGRTANGAGANGGGIGRRDQAGLLTGGRVGGGRALESRRPGSNPAGFRS